MIAKDSTSTVNFIVLDLDGFPATGKASSISATISINGGQASVISDTITEKGSGWYYFNHNFDTAGNAFITFTAANCTIMPWEDEVVEATGASASDIAYAVWSDKRTYPMFQGTPMGYYQANPPIVNVWGQKPWPQENTTYGDLVKSIPTVNTNVSAVKAKTDNLPASPAATGDAMTLTSAAITAVQSGLSTFNAVSDTVTINATQAATMVTATGFATPTNITAAQTAIINAMPSTSGLATSSDVSTAQSAIIAAMPDVSGLSTFNPSTDNVNVSSTSISSIQSGLATASNVSSAQSAIISAMPDITGLSTFDPANDTVLIDSTQAAGMATATGFATPSDVANAAAELEIYGDAHWYGDGITARDVWTYTGPRTLTASPTDISSLATKTDLTSAKTAIIGAMPDVSGLSTFNPSTDTVLIDATQAATFATPSDISTAQEAIINAVEGIDLSGLATSTDTAVLNAELQELIGGVMNWYVTANTLTIYSPSNTVIRTYSITRDPEGNITRIQPNNG